MSIISKKAPGSSCGFCLNVFDDTSDSVTHTGYNGERHDPLCRDCFRACVKQSGKCPLCQEAINVRSLFSWTEWLGYSAKKFASNALIAGVTTAAAAYSPIPAASVIISGASTVAFSKLNDRVDPGLLRWDNPNHALPILIAAPVVGGYLVSSLTEHIRMKTGLEYEEMKAIQISIAVSSVLGTVAAETAQKIRGNSLAIGLGVVATGCVMLTLPLSITTVVAISAVASGALALLLT